MDQMPNAVVFYVEVHVKGQLSLSLLIHMCQSCNTIVLTSIYETSTYNFYFSQTLNCHSSYANAGPLLTQTIRPSIQINLCKKAIKKPT